MPILLLIVSVFVGLAIFGACNDDSAHCQSVGTSSVSAQACTDSNGVTTWTNH